MMMENQVKLKLGYFPSLLTPLLGLHSLEPILRRSHEVKQDLLVVRVLLRH